MLVYINGYFLVKRYSGVHRFALNILKQLDIFFENEKSIKLICLVPWKIEFKFKNIKLQVNKSNIRFIDNKQQLWEQLVLPFIVREQFLINFASYAPLFKKNQLLVVHDVIPFYDSHANSKSLTLLFKLTLKILVKRVKYLAAVSNFTSDEIKRVTNVYREIIVLGNSAEQFRNINADTQILTRLGLTPKSYIFAVSSQSHVGYKNFKLLKQVSKTIGYPIVASGGIAEYLDNILYTGYLSDEELKALYTNAIVFIFPSLYEGFGIPPLEAFICGCPVLASDIKVFHEVYGNAVSYFDPQNTDDLILKFHQLIADEVFCKNLIEMGYIQGEKYRWHDITIKIIKLIGN